jgi:electron transfer flavoprotein beta subunit
MKIFVALKRVPHTATKIRLAPAPHDPAAGGRCRSIQVDNVEFTISPYDEIALAEAIRIKEQLGGEVVALSLGGDDAQGILRTALAMGADSAIHIRAPLLTGLELDGYQTSAALHAVLRERTFDLLLFGRLAVDDQSSQVGTMVARLLGIPSVADVVKVEPLDGRVRLHHLVEGRVEVVECRLPAAATAQKALAEPRYPSVKQILAAKKKTIESVEAHLPEPALECLGLELSPPRKPGRIVGQGAAAVPELVRLLREEAKVL